jgi:Domain of unknown function (DUF5615)
VVKFYFDEDSAQHRLVAALRSHALDVVTCLDAGMNARDDESHLILAAEQGRVLISSNAGDFASQHRQWLVQERLQSGIPIIPKQRYSTGEIVRRILRVPSSRFDVASGIYYCQTFEFSERAAGTGRGPFAPTGVLSPGINLSQRRTSGPLYESRTRTKPLARRTLRVCNPGVFWLTLF